MSPMPPTRRGGGFRDSASDEHEADENFLTSVGETVSFMLMEKLLVYVGGETVSFMLVEKLLVILFVERLLCFWWRSF